MKILIVHNFYGSESPSGENTVFELEHSMLERRGHEVQTLIRHSDSIRLLGVYGLLVGAISTPWNFRAAQEMKSKVSEFQPDIVHAHNTFPLLSPSVFRAARGAGRVLTLHNYRLFCPAAIPMRDNLVCTECIDQRSVIPALKHGCYRNSRVATLPLAINVALNRLIKTWENEIEAFVTLTDFQRDSMVGAGLPAQNVRVKPNFYPGNPATVPFRNRPPRVVFAGRLSKEKGVDGLISAWLNWGSDAPELRIIGCGPLLNELQIRCSGATNITFCGQMSNQDAQLEIGSAQMLILPSLCFEGFPMVLREAFAFGTPSLVSHLGPLPALVSQGQGVVFRAGDVRDLLSKSKKLWGDKAQLEKMGDTARAVFEREYTEEVNYKRLMSIYEEAIAKSKLRPT